jgi:hypothetical protein
MIKTMKFIAAAAVALIALQSVAAMAQTERAARYDVKWPKTRTAQPAACDTGQACDSALEFSWGSSNPQSLHIDIDSADFTPAKGGAFSVCSSAACASSKVNVQDLSFTRQKDFPFWPGTIVLHTPVNEKCVQGVHFKEVTLRQGAIRLHLTDVLVTTCDSNSVSLSYQGMARGGGEAGQPELMSICTMPIHPSWCHKSGGFVEATLPPMSDK